MGLTASADLRRAMSKALRNKAKEFLGFGMPKQSVFDTLVLEHPEAKAKKIAEVVRYLPSLEARERYRALHMSLLALVALYGALRVAKPFIDGEVAWSPSYRLVSLAPIATVLLGWSIYRWQGQVFEWVGWMNLLGASTLVSALGAWAKGTGDPWTIALSALSAGIGLLSLYLARRAFAKPKEEKDPLGGLARYVFPADEPG